MPDFTLRSLPPRCLPPQTGRAFSTLSSALSGYSRLSSGTLRRNGQGMFSFGKYLAITGLIVWFSTSSTFAQSSKATKSKSKSAANSANVKQLDLRSLEMQERLLRDATEIAKGYEDAGEFDRAKWLLEVLEKLDPKLPGLKDKISQLTDKSLDSSEYEIEMDVAKDWTPIVGMVYQGRVVRIVVDGEYKLNVALSVTADGVAVNETGSEMVAGIPLGALMGVILDPKDKKPGKPFELKAKREWTPRESGFLQLRMNLPSGHRSTGKVTVKLGGVSRIPN